jgi:hypothetical protein
MAAAAQLDLAGAAVGQRYDQHALGGVVKRSGCGAVEPSAHVLHLAVMTRLEPATEPLGRSFGALGRSETGARKAELERRTDDALGQGFSGIHHAGRHLGKLR